VAGGGLEGIMHGLVREIEEERPAVYLSRPEPFQGAIGEDIGRVAPDLLRRAVDVEHRIKVDALALETDPVIESGPGSSCSCPICHLPMKAV